MVLLEKKYHPIALDFTKIEPYNSAFVEYTFLGDDKYEMVEAEKVKPINDESVTFFRNGQRISKTLYFSRTDKNFKVKKNNVVFICEEYVCFLDIYITNRSKIVPIITVEFGNEQEMNKFVPQKWFGAELNTQIFNEKVLWQIFKSYKK